MNNYTILIVDDEAPMRTLVKIYLEQSGYQVAMASGGLEAIAKIKESAIDLVILDVMMPGMSGWETCQQIRTFSEVPILMLTARNETVDKVKGLNIGADDYLGKPFEEIELLARIGALLRRAGKETRKNVIEHNRISLDLDARTVCYLGSEIELTPKEFELLKTLLDNRGRVYSRDQLLEQIWGLDYVGETRTVDSHVKNLREKLRKHSIDSESLIKTVWGTGYKGI